MRTLTIHTLSIQIDTQPELAQEAVRDAIKHSWDAYVRFAWGEDEVTPLSHRGRTTFGDTGITIVDSIDTLLLADMHAEASMCVDVWWGCGGDGLQSPTATQHTTARYTLPHKPTPYPHRAIDWVVHNLTFTAKRCLSLFEYVGCGCVCWGCVWSLNQYTHSYTHSHTKTPHAHSPPTLSLNHTLTPPHTESTFA